METVTSIIRAEFNAKVKDWVRLSRGMKLIFELNEKAGTRKLEIAIFPRSEYTEVYSRLCWSIREFKGNTMWFCLSVQEGDVWQTCVQTILKAFEDRIKTIIRPQESAWYSEIKRSKEFIEGQHYIEDMLTAEFK